MAKHAPRLHLNSATHSPESHLAQSLRVTEVLVAWLVGGAPKHANQVQDRVCELFVPGEWIQISCRDSWGCVK